MVNVIIYKIKEKINKHYMYKDMLLYLKVQQKLFECLLTSL